MYISRYVYLFLHMIILILITNEYQQCSTLKQELHISQQTRIIKKGGIHTGAIRLDGGYIHRQVNDHR